jgi:hypothetical protein
MKATIGKFFFTFILPSVVKPLYAFKVKGKPELIRILSFNRQNNLRQLLQEMCPFWDRPFVLSLT